MVHAPSIVPSFDVPFGVHSYGTSHLRASCPQAHTGLRAEVSEWQDTNGLLVLSDRFTGSALITHPATPRAADTSVNILYRSIKKSHSIECQQVPRLFCSWNFCMSTQAHMFQAKGISDLNKCSAFWVSAGDRTLTPVKIEACPIPIVSTSFVLVFGYFSQVATNTCQ